MELPSKAVLILVLVLLLSLSASSPYHLQKWMVKENLSPYDAKEICMGDSANNMVCITRDDMQLFKDKRFGPDQLCLGNPKVCVNSGHLQSMLSPACRDTATPWNDFGDKNYAFLDRHDVRCADNEKLVRQKLETNNNRQVRIAYRCCK